MNTPESIRIALKQIARTEREIAGYERSLKIHEAAALLKANERKELKNAESRQAGVILALANEPDYQEELSHLDELRLQLANQKAEVEYHRSVLRIEIAQMKGE